MAIVYALAWCPELLTATGLTMASHLSHCMASLALRGPISASRTMSHCGEASILPKVSEAFLANGAARALSTSLSDARSLSLSSPHSDSLDVNFRSVRSFSKPAIAADRESYGEAEQSQQGRPPLSERLVASGFMCRLPKKPAPSVVSRRIAKLRTYVGEEKAIRHSPWRLNLVCQFAAGQTVPDALEQLLYVQKVKAPLVRKVIKHAVRRAARDDGLLPSQLEVAECFATHGKHMPRVKFMGRGRAGRMHRRFSHVRLVLREIDFPLKIATTKTLAGKQKWLDRMKLAEAEAKIAQEKRDELEALEKEAEEQRKKREAEEKAK